MGHSAAIDVLLRPEEWAASLADGLRAGLTAANKQISPIWLYDERGSALFDEITRLPEYYVTRAEARLLAAHAHEITSIARAETLVELGSGSSEKTRTLLAAMDQAGDLRQYVALDASDAALRAAVGAVSADFPDVDVRGVTGDFHQHLTGLGRGRRLVAFLGSTIGNLSPAERRRFLFDLECGLERTDSVLIGFDLVKPRDRLIAAYNDREGVTARFNLNALRHLNEAAQADFDLDAFRHSAIWNDDEQRIEMRVIAERPQNVRVGALELDIELAAGEAIRTEISSKFTVGGALAELHDAGLVVERSWGAGGDFLLVLAHPYC